MPPICGVLRVIGGTGGQHVGNAMVAREGKKQLVARPTPARQAGSNRQSRLDVVPRVPFYAPDIGSTNH
jgi:hypothetical protein